MVEHFDHDMNVIRHYAPSEQAIAVGIEMQHSLLDHIGDLRIAQPTRAEPGIEFPVEKRYRIVFCTQHLDQMARQAVGQAKGDELHCVGRVEVRQVTSGMPAFVLDH